MRNGNGGHEEASFPLPPGLASILMGDPELLGKLRGMFSDDNDETFRTPEELAEQEATDKRISQDMVEACRRNSESFQTAETALKDVRQAFATAVGYKGADPKIFSILEKIDSAEAVLYSLRVMVLKADRDMPGLSDD